MILSGLCLWLVYDTVGILTQMLPGLMAGYWMVSSISVGELAATLQRMRVPLSVTVPLTVMFRFFPTAVSQRRAIRDAMSMRGVRWGGGKAVQMVEYRVIPLMAGAIRSADELSQAAVTRGLGSGRSRTSIARIGFSAYDAVVLVACASCYACWLLSTMGVL